MPASDRTVQAVSEKHEEDLVVAIGDKVVPFDVYVEEWRAQIKWLRDDIERLEKLISEQNGGWGNSSRTELMRCIRNRTAELREMLALPKVEFDR